MPLATARRYRNRAFIGAVLLLTISVLPCGRGSRVVQERATLVNNLLVLTARVNGSQQLPFVLDTGASATVIDRRRAESLRLTATEYREYRVRSVVAGSPAAAAGVATGDVLTSINGKSARELTLSELRELFRKEGQRRGGTPLRTELRTRRLV